MRNSRDYPQTNLRWYIWVLLAIGLCLVTGLSAVGNSASAQGKQAVTEPALLSSLLPKSSPGTGSEQVVYPTTLASSVITPTNHSIYLPILSAQPLLATRIGYAIEQASTISRAASGDPAAQDLLAMRAGWYLNWGVNKEPLRPNGMEYAQMVRVHQALTCSLDDPNAWDRVRCPYKHPLSFSYLPDDQTIRATAKAQPGSLWLIGNEIDRRDWPGGHQDEILPETYAEAYHYLYNLIKDADPTARIAIGGVVQMTPLRMQYIEKIWDTYLAKYGEPIPVDVWNMHVFVLPERRNSWGADIPVGFEDIETGAYIFRPDSQGNPTVPMPEHIDIQYVYAQTRRFRSWLKEKGEQEKPVIVTEYGVLMYNWMMGFPEEDATPVIDYMLTSFDYFLNTRDCTLGPTWDDCRLVQRWLWYSADFVSNFNPHSRLVDPDSLAITSAGQAYKNWVEQHLYELARTPYP